MCPAVGTGVSNHGPKSFGFAQGLGLDSSSPWRAPRRQLCHRAIGVGVFRFRQATPATNRAFGICRSHRFRIFARLETLGFSMIFDVFRV